MVEDKNQVQSGVYIRQIQLLYKNQTIAIISTIAVLAVAFEFIGANTDRMMLLPWGVAFGIVLLLRAIATWVYLRQIRMNLMDYTQGEWVYFIGITATALVWASMIHTLFPILGVTEKFIVITLVFGLIAASHITMGYRKSSYHTYTVIILSPTIYHIYVSDLPGKMAIVMAGVIFLVYMIGASISFYKTISELLTAEEETIKQKHKLMMQREQANLESQAKSDFLSRMSHELRTPLNAVIGLNELQIRDREHSLMGVQLERAAKIRDASTHLLNLVNDILDLSRIESNTLSVDLAPVDCVQLLNESMKLVEIKADEFNVQVDIITPSESVWVVADRKRLKQVFVNLLDNAVKYNHRDGRVGITLERAEGECWLIAVEDTGQGISENNLEDLFKPFARLDMSSDAIEGAGVGLSFSKKLILLMNGEIGVHSKSGEGSCFWIRLPATSPLLDEEVIKQNLVASDDYEERLATGQLREGRLLLVEDNEVNQEVAYDMLNEMGFEIDVANNGAEALEALEKSQYAGVLMDCQMPVMDGISATRELRNKESQHRLTHTPVIALTAHALQGAREQCLASGMDDFLSKPFSYEDLCSTLKRWVVVPEGMGIRDHEMNVSSDEVAGDESVIDVVALSRLRTRKSSLVNKVVTRYLDESPAILEEINDCSARHDYEDLSFQVHTFKSSSLTVGASEVADSCRHIEAMCTDGDVDSAVIGQLCTNYELARNELRQILQSGEYSDPV